MKKNRILLVEDEESLLKLETILFTTRGYRVTGVSDGASALDLIRKSPPDLVILDVMLPGMDGFDICRAIKDDPASAGIPVVILSAKKSGPDLERGRTAGADAYLTKPFKAVKVLQVIEGLIGGES
ncbi:response regulator transcription factor [Geomesophilobacter sediminis]|uniref:Response regulator n=1 Tax=Geomesophilobacter sediminis TaxID=2798584 RepID=A0A8J7M3X1_9BACT|nr:response regulator [Geomesophilobacter sediminis]MBJ6727726.1 response regulator [Geomesophilobacter sediminis]